ncbi:MAG: RDD family protein [Verrucomicrobiales bacterium]|nr:RDD family protein [Verrucomicrobiales bacterium]MCP5560599.1 RDD family protein [Verrucomicrobiaceae bacterium]
MSDTNPYAPPQSDVSAIPMDGSEQPLAQKRTRLFAQLIDGLINAAILFPLQYLTGAYHRIATAAQAGQTLTMDAIVWALIGVGVYLALNWRLLTQGQTIGKRAMGIRIVSKDGTPTDRKNILTKRLLPLWLAAQVPYIGMVIVLVDTLCIFRAGRNTLHDDLANTKVVKA